MKHRTKELLARIGSASLIIAAAAGFVSYSAFALNVDQTRNTAARTFSTQQSTYHRITINFNDPRFPNPQKFGRYLVNQYLDHIQCYVITAFNSGSSDQLSIGVTSPAANEIMAAGAVTITSVGDYNLTTALVGIGVAATSDADHDLYVNYKHTGTAPTAGKVTCVLESMPNDDN